MTATTLGEGQHAHRVDCSAVPLLPYCDDFPRTAFTPTRDPARDWSDWGAWEVSPHCVQCIRQDGAMFSVPSGLWQMWDSSKAHLGARAIQVMATDDSRRDAIGFCGLRNMYRLTRLLEVDGSEKAYNALSPEIQYAIHRGEWDSPGWSVAQAVLLIISERDDVAVWLF